MFNALFACFCTGDWFRSIFNKKQQEIKGLYFCFCVIFTDYLHSNDETPQQKVSKYFNFFAFCFVSGITNYALHGPFVRVVSMCNQNIGGVDRFNENVNSQRISFSGKMWWYLLVAFLIDAACQNAWKNYQTVNKKKDYLMCISP